jgi:hypothetical protein
MSSQEEGGKVTICIFGFLRRYTEQQGLPHLLEKSLPPEGLPASELARELSIPREKIEAVFRDGRVINLYDTVYPGNRVSFFPFGTPGPHRVFLGMARENVERTRRERINIEEECPDEV